MEFKLVTQFLDKAVEEMPDRLGFADETCEMTFKQMQENAFLVARAILDGLSNKHGNIAVIMPSGVAECACIHAIMYSKNAFSCVDDKMPNERILKILDVLEPIAILTDEKTKEKVDSLNFDGPVFVYEECLKTKSNAVLPEIEANDITTNEPAGIIFTSGSTGTPKGVIQSHKSLISVAVSFRDDIGVKASDHMGIQSPLYYGLGIHDTFIALSAMATSFYIPKNFFTQPEELAKFLIEKKISLVYWSTNAAMIASRFSIWEGHEEELSKTMRVISFAGDSPSTKLVNKMRLALPNIEYYQGYGSTEYFYNFYNPIVDEISDDSVIPIGQPAKFAHAYIYTEDEKLCEVCRENKGLEGQLCIEGPGLSLGYLKDDEGTKNKYRIHPSKPGVRVLFTGDIVSINDEGKVVFKTRKDFMVKMMGHRIELGEIEITACSLDDTMQCACVYDKKKERIIMAYVGKYQEKELKKMLKSKLPAHMIPREIIKLDKLPLNPSNKIDRLKLQEICIK